MLEMQFVMELKALFSIRPAICYSLALLILSSIGVAAIFNQDGSGWKEGGDGILGGETFDMAVEKEIIGKAIVAGGGDPWAECLCAKPDIKVICFRIFPSRLQTVSIAFDVVDES